MTNIAKWVVALHIDCPACKNTFDIHVNDKNIDYDIELLKDGLELDATCPECEFEFTCETES